MEDDFEIVDAILEARGIEDVGSFLKPSIEDMIPFEEMLELHDAYCCIEDGIGDGEKFLILADVDADGCCSCAIIARYLRALGAEVKCVINDGKKHGAEDFDLSLLDDVGTMIIE